MIPTLDQKGEHHVMSSISFLKLQAKSSNLLKQVDRRYFLVFFS
jgi:hypothetical protein